MAETAIDIFIPTICIYPDLPRVEAARAARFLCAIIICDHACPGAFWHTLFTGAHFDAISRKHRRYAQVIAKGINDIFGFKVAHFPLPHFRSSHIPMSRARQIVTKSDI